MLHFKRHKRAISRLLSGVFAMQVLAAGFCLLTPQMHAAIAAESAMPMSHEMVSHCDNGDKKESGHAGHDSACAHCDLPDELITSKVSVADFSVQLSLAVIATAPISTLAPQSVDLAVRTPTGPPDSSFLLYTTSQRIRI